MMGSTRVLLLSRASCSCPTLPCLPSTRYRFHYVPHPLLTLHHTAPLIRAPLPMPYGPIVNLTPTTTHCTLPRSALSGNPPLPPKPLQQLQFSPKGRWGTALSP